MDSKLMDVGAERAVLAGLFAYGIESYVEICDLIDYKTFGHQNNQVLYKCLEKVLQSEVLVDVPAVLSAASQLGLSEAINTKQELEYINSLIQFPVKKENVVHFAGQIKKFEFARKIKSLAAKIGRDVDEIKGDENIDDIIGLIENPIMEFLREDETNTKPEKLGDGIEEYLDFLINNKCDQIEMRPNRCCHRVSKIRCSNWRGFT